MTTDFIIIISENNRLHWLNQIYKYIFVLGNFHGFCIQFSAKLSMVDVWKWNKKRLKTIISFILLKQSNKAFVCFLGRGDESELGWIKSCRDDGMNGNKKLKCKIILVFYKKKNPIKCEFFPSLCLFQKKVMQLWKGPKVDQHLYNYTWYWFDSVTWMII